MTGWKAILSQFVPEPERADDLDAVGADLEPCPDLFELGGALVDLDLEAALVQRNGGGQPADASAHDDHAEWTVFCDLLHAIGVAADRDAVKFAPAWRR